MGSHRGNILHLTVHCLSAVYKPGREAIADQANVPFFEKAERLLDRTRPDGAIIATPSAQHVDAFELCARRNIHALIEKPVADTTAAARRIAELASTTGTRALVGHHRRHNPLVKEAHAVVVGQIGRLVAVSVMWALMKPDDYFRVGWRTKRPDGGPVLINLVHELDTLRYVCGEIEQVFAQSSSAARGFEVEDSVSISLTFRNGAVGTIIASDATAAPWSYEATSGENFCIVTCRRTAIFSWAPRARLPSPRWSFGNTPTMAQEDGNTR